MTTTTRLSIGIIVAIGVVIAGVALIQGKFTAPSQNSFPFDLANAPYSFMGDNFSLQNGSATIQGHAGLSGIPTNTLVPIGYTLAATTTGNIQGNTDGIAVLYRGFGADLQWLTLFGFSDKSGVLEQIASSTIYTEDSKVESVSVNQNIVSVNLLVVSTADMQNLPHYEQVPNQPLVLHFVLSDNAFIPTSATSTQSETYGMSEYTDATYGFSFWYPSAIQITTTPLQDATAFPGGIAVQNIQIGPQGGTSIFVVNSPTASITDEPTNHASPIGQTKYFYDSASGEWMVTFPQGTDGQGSSATTTANISQTTMSGLIMLPSGRRFDTKIIPLSTTQFLVIGDGGGSSFTSQLAQTVVQTGVSVDLSAQAAALQAEAAAYGNTQ